MSRGTMRRDLRDTSRLQQVLTAPEEVKRTRTLVKEETRKMQQEARTALKETGQIEVVKAETEKVEEKPVLSRKLGSSRLSRDTGIYLNEVQLFVRLCVRAYLCVCVYVNFFQG